MASPSPSSSWLCCSGNEKRVFKVAFLSRLLVLALSLLWAAFGTPYDTSARLDPPCLAADPPGVAAPLEMDPQSGLGVAIRSSVVWDSVYYVRIARCGYEYEQTFAFQPFLPLFMRLLANLVFFKLVPVIGYTATLAFSGYAMNLLVFPVAAVYLYKISLFVLGDEKLAYRAAALFCFNPASIFYSSIYSETLFSLFTFVGLWRYLLGSNWMASIMFAISSGMRSNGVLNAGFLIFKGLHVAYGAFFHHKRPLKAIMVLIASALQTLVVFSPFVAFQVYGYRQICITDNKLDVKGGSPWCHALIPYLYGYVQSHYWDVGFLRYFQLKQLPNFLLASPMLALAVGSIAHFAKQEPWLLLSLGLQRRTEPSAVGLSSMDKANKEFPSSPFARSLTESLIRHRKWQGSKDYMGGQEQKSRHGSSGSGDGGIESEQIRAFLSPAAIPFLLEMAFMVFFATLVMHVQVATRFLSACPPLYWFAALFMDSSASNRYLGRIIWAIFFVYTSLGSLLFVNFYPFT